MTETNGIPGETTFGVIARGLLHGLVVFYAVTIPRDVLFAANAVYLNAFPWAVILMGLYLLYFWHFLKTKGLRARPVHRIAWFWAIVAGGLGTIALILGYRVASRLTALPQVSHPDEMPGFTILCLLVAAAPIAAVAQEVGFRGYLQEPVERRSGLAVAILVCGLAYPIARFDLNLALWPYYLAIAAVYGAVTSYTGSVVPAIVLHTGANLYTVAGLWLRDASSPAAPPPLIRESGVDADFWFAGAGFVFFAAASIWAFRILRRLRDGGFNVER